MISYDIHARNFAMIYFVIGFRALVYRYLLARNQIFATYAERNELWTGVWTELWPRFYDW